MYFETPDLRSAKGWKRHREREPTRGWSSSASYLAARPADSLETLIRDDRRFTDPKQTLDAYAEAWALTYFLIHKHPKEYVSYLRTLSEKKPLMQDGPERRLDEFRQAFGDLSHVDTEFVRYMTRGR